MSFGQATQLVGEGVAAGSNGLGIAGPTKEAKSQKRDYEYQTGADGEEADRHR